MSYDLYFYRRKERNLTEKEIAGYLTENLSPPSESGQQWFVENKDTEAYFSMDQNEPETDEESIALFENFIDFDNTHFSFNLNFLRPDFFGQFAFSFINKFLHELDLYVLNPQSLTDPDHPLKPTDGELYENWSAINASQCSRFYKEYELLYYPVDKSNDHYQYNYHRNRLQDELGDNYFVPKIYYFKRKSDSRVITLSTWTQHIPTVFPPVDYYLIIKKYKKLLLTIEEDLLISAATLDERFGHLLSDFNFKGCKIIHPTQAAQAKDIFNSTKTGYQIGEFAEHVPIEKLVNNKPDQDHDTHFLT